MPLTREQMTEIKSAVKETVAEIFKDDGIISSLIDKIITKVNSSLATQFNITAAQISDLNTENNSLKQRIEELEQQARQNNIRIVGMKNSTSILQNATVSA